jgi:DNA-directed RNA polymerase subunit RPC12/RpoP
VTNNTLFEIAPDIKVWGCPRCDKVGISITKEETFIQCPTRDCGFKWIIKNAVFKEAVVAWNRLIINQTKEVSLWGFVK